MTTKEKEFFKLSVKYELKVAKAKVKNLEYVLELLNENYNDEVKLNETRKSRNKDKYSI